MCASEEILIDNELDNPVLMFEYNGEGLTHNCSYNSSGYFEIRGVVDTVPVTVDVNNYGFITQLGPAFIIIEGPYVSFDYAFDCNDPYIYSFSSNMLEATSFEWDFGDGNTETTIENPVHHFDSTGDYTVQLHAYNEETECSYTYTQIVKVRDLQASFILEDTLCVGTYPVDLSECTDLYSPIDKPYFWYKDNQPIGYKDTTFEVFVSEGMQSIRLIVRDENHCTDTVEHLVVGLQPHANFLADETLGCSPFLPEFTDISETLYGIMERYWVVLGDTVSNDSIMHYQFDNVGDFSVQLIIVDSLGCKNVINKHNYIHVADPIANIAANDFTICEGEEITFTTSYNTADSIVWYIDTNKTVTMGNTSISATFDHYGEYSASLVVWESSCSDSAVANYQIQVQEANADYSASDTISDCYPADITFDFQGENPSHVVDWVWTFGDNDAGSVFADTVRYNYGHPGVYTTSLSTVTSYGCEASATFDITVLGPLGDLIVDPLVICYGETVNYEVVNLVDVGAFVLDYGDGYTTEEVNSEHTYDNQYSGIIHPTLILFSDAENPNLCKVDVGSILNVHRVVPEFNVKELKLDEDTLRACHPFEGIFENSSTGANQYTWDFGNGTISNEEDVHETLNNFSFTDSVSYNVHLTARYSNVDCIEDTSIVVTVLPVPNVNLNQDQVICEGDTTQIVVNGNLNSVLTWYPEELNDNYNIWSPLVSPEVESEYIATLNLNSCLNSDTVVIKIQDELDVEWSMDTTVIIGQSAPMFAVTNQNSSVPLWLPNYELSCDTCMRPVATPLESTTYVFEVSDSLGCITYREEINIEVDEQYKVNLPTTFSPNSDGVNDVIYVEGWGIENLLEYRIFNRWGDEVFHTSDINQGWDGTYRGSVQNIDSYAYRVKAQMYSGQVITKEGTITLLR